MMKKIAFILALSISAISFGCTKTPQQGTWISWPSGDQIQPSVQNAMEAVSAGDLMNAAEQLAPLRDTDMTAAYLHAEILALQGNLRQAISAYTAFVAKYPNDSLTAAALVRLRMLSDAQADLLDWDAISALNVADPYAKAQLVVLQNRAMRNHIDATTLTHPTATPLVKWHWFGPFSTYIQTGFKAEQPFDKDELLAEQYEVNGRVLEPFQYTPENVTAMAAKIQGIYAAETTIKTTQKQDVQITVHGAQLYTVYVDGIPVITRDISSFGQEALLSATFELAPGEHVVRIRLGLTPSAGNTRQIAVWMAADNEISELDGRLEKRPQNTVHNVRRIDSSSVLGDDTVPVPEDPFKSWTAAIIAIADGKVQVADKLIQARLQKNPDDKFATYLLALRYRKDSDLDDTVRKEMSMEYLRDVSANAPQFAIAHQILMTEFIKQNQPKQALRIWETYRNELPSNDAYTSLILGQLTNAMSWTEISEEYTQIAAEQAPNSCRLNAALIELQNRNHIYPAYTSLSERLQACPDIIRHYAKLDGNDPAGNSRDNDWIAQIRKLSDRYPAEAALRLEAIQAIATTNPEIAAAEFMQVFSQNNMTFLYAPAIDGDTVLRVIDSLRAAGRDDLASQILDKAIEFMPYEANLQYMRVKAQDARLFDDLRIDGIQTIKDYLAQNREDPGNSVMLLDYAATKILPDGTKIGLTHQISRVLTKEGKNAVGEIYLPDDAAILKVRTVKDGSFEIFEPESIGFKSSITAPNLAVGDYVETEYLTFEKPSSLVSSRVATDPFFFGAEMVPIVRSEYVVDYPRDWDVKIVQSGPENLIQLSCTPNGEFTRCVSKRENIPPFIPSERSDTVFDLIPNIQFSYLYDWDFIQNALFETFTRQSRVTPYLKKFHEKIEFPHNSNRMEHARTIYNYVIENIHESDSSTTDSESATSTVTRGVGSRLLVLKALYDIEGLPSFLALRRLFGAASKADDLPALYNSTHEHVLVVDVGNGQYAYVQPEEGTVPFDFIDTTSMNQPVMPVDPAFEPFVSRTDELTLAISENSMHFAISEDGSASAKMNETIRGTRAIIMRNMFNMLKGDKDVMHQVIQNSLAQNYGRVNLTDFSHTYLDNLNAPFGLDYAFDIAQFAGASTDKIEILSRIFAYNLVNQYASKAPGDMKRAMYITDTKLAQRSMYFEVPEGFHWQNEPVNLHIETKFGKYSREISHTEDELVLTESIELLPQRIELKDYADFRDFCLAVDEAQRSALSAVK